MRVVIPGTRLWSIIAVNADKDMGGFDLTNLGDVALANGSSLQAANVDNNIALIRARDNGVGMATIARLVGGADPYLEHTLPSVSVQTARPATPVTGHRVYNTATKQLDIYDGAKWCQEMLGRIVRKTVTEVVNNSAVLQNDEELVLAVGASEVWQIEMRLLVLFNAAASFKFQFTVPALATIAGCKYDECWTFVQFQAPASLVLSAPQVCVGGGAGQWIVAHILYIGGVNAGNIQLQWAQNVAHASDCSVFANSSLLATRLA